MKQFGILEGFFGPPWSWSEREASLGFMADHGLNAYLYAPKADRHLRSKWREEHPQGQQEQLRQFAKKAQSQGVQFFIGLSPLDLHATWDEAGEQALLTRVRQLLHLGVNGLGLFFDDMRGDIPDLARRQGEMVSAVREQFPTLPLLMCPTYYTPHAVLDKVFGQRPENYLKELGEALPDDVQVFYTGDEVCSSTYSAQSLSEVRRVLGRKVAIWDNYPVNDGPRMCKHLHLRPPGGRDFALQEEVSSWWVNPMNQPTLSRLPIAALSAAFERSQPTKNAQELAERLYGSELGKLIWSSVALVQDQGLDKLSESSAKELVEQLTGFEHPAAQELRRFLLGDYIVGPECLTDTED